MKAVTWLQKSLSGRILSCAVLPLLMGWVLLLFLPRAVAVPSGIITLTGDVRTYNRAGGTNAATLMSLGLVPEVGIQIRLLPSWFLKVSNYQSAQEKFAATAVGLRIAMPGFFLMGEDLETDYRKRRRMRRVETALHVDLSQIVQTVDDVPLRFFSPRGLFVADWRLGRRSHFFILTDLGLQTMRGNLYATGALGLGVEF